MATLILGLTAFVVVLVSWRSGYAAGRQDGALGVSQPFPWSAVVRDRKEG